MSIFINCDGLDERWASLFGPTFIGRADEVIK